MSKTKQVLYSSSNYITTQDVPDELALAISLSGCPIHCKGCHSAFTWDPFFGELLTDDMFRNIIKNNKYASCVLFYGGEWQLERLLELIEIAKEYNLKVCLYTGLELEKVDKTLINSLDYLKVGPYIEQLGGLNKKTTNQKMYKIENGQLTDITNKFYQS